MKAFYVLSGALAVIAVDDFLRGSVMAWQALILAVANYAVAEYLDDAQKRQIRRAARDLRELSDSLGDR